MTRDLLDFVLNASPQAAEKANNSKQLPLHRLCENEHASMHMSLIELLYLKYPQAAKEENWDKKEPPQMWPCYVNKNFVDVPKEHEFLVACLQTAARHGDHDTFKKLIARGVDPDEASKADPQSARNIGQVTEKDTDVLKYYGKVNRLLGMFKLDKVPKHTSGTCVAIEARDVTIEPLRGMSQQVMLKFMKDKDAWEREIEKRHQVLCIMTQDAVKDAQTALENLNKASQDAIADKALSDAVAAEEKALAVQSALSKAFGGNAVAGKPRNGDEGAWYYEIEHSNVLKIGHMIPITKARVLKPKNLKSHEQVKLTNDKEQPPLYLIVMPLGIRDLYDEMSHRAFSVSDPQRVLGIATSVAKSLKYLNEVCQIMHGNLPPVWQSGHCVCHASQEM